jgi:ATP-binding cassette subfamily B multidrug efflux pump
VSQSPPKAAARPKYTPPAGAGMFGGPRAVEKSVNFRSSLKRLLGHLRPERMTMLLVVALAVAGILMSVVGPRILGRGTDIIFTGVVGQHMPAGASKEQVVAGLRLSGHRTFADLIE